MSEQFVVSALKYRPQTFDTVVGQEHITTTLKNAIRTGHVAHSFLFCGPRGVGKTTCARILAKTLNCSNLSATTEACDTCDNCRTFNNNTSFNIFELDAASNNSVDDIRHLTEQVRFAPSEGSKYKVYIIDEVHMLSQAAFNAFLKTLEEPPSYAVFILATTEKHRILPTILSRCQIFDFKRITSNDVVGHLKSICEKENIPSEEDALHFIALKSEGCMRDALSIMDKITSFGGGNITYQGTIDNLNILDYDYFFKFTDHLMLQDTKACMLLLDEVLGKGFEGDSILLGLAEHMRNLLVCKDIEMTRLLEVTNSIKKRYQEQATLASPNLILNALSILNQADIDYKLARNKRLHVELSFIKMCNLTRALELISNADGSIAKKKVISNRTVALITKAGVLTKSDSASLEIDSKITTTTPKLKVPQAPVNTAPAPQLSLPEKPATIAEPKPIINTVQEAAPAPNITPKPASALGAAGGLRAIVQAAKQQAAEQIKKDKKPLTEEALQEVWLQIVEKQSGGNDFFKSALLKTHLTIVEEQISFIAEGTMALGMLTEKRSECLRLLKEHFHNDDITLQIVADASKISTEKKVRTKREILEEWLAKYPMLKEMKDELGFELDV
jgi:DNA polymerase III subunit gamma/tau